MKEKEKLIIESAIKLFALKGFSSTSVQDIVTESGISKGAFYLYFKSKDALLLAILQYYFDKIQKSLSAHEDKNLSPRERFTKQLNALFETLVEHREFMIMQSREQAIPLNESIKKLIFNMHLETQQFYRNGLLSVYGEKIEPFLWDLSAILDGLFQSYVRILLIDKQNFDSLELAEFLMRRMDSISQAITSDHPILTDEKVENLLNKTKSLFLKDKNHVITLLETMKKELKKMDEKEDLEISLEVLQSEINRENPRIPVIQGMLSNFKGIAQFDTYRKEIASFYDLKV
ncbi:TetR/AcrR family transcriptional regulator [Priestia abyssalis]|uniref:TetR/AcrR family transcriptional regulator n=1 Tax=Priestia abyssalis TaxID=1221450 RepID=UPI00099534BA|nr:TetR/AcrR family transcriptional regulator [Priestia abyssalis]